MEVLEKQDAGRVHPGYRGRVDTPRPAQVRSLARAASLLPPLLCLAVRGVAFIDLSSEPAVVGWTMADEAQDLVYLNSAQGGLWHNARIERSPTARARAMQNFAHEAAHAAVRLLQSRQRGDPAAGSLSGGRPGTPPGRPGRSPQDAAAAGQAKGFVASNGLEAGPLPAWIRMHDSFVARGLAGPYYGDAWSDAGTVDLDHPKNGFASAYGGQSPLEDMAELTGWALAGYLFVGGAKSALQGRVCEALRGRGEVGVPDELAALQAKLGFLRRLGFIDHRSYLRCGGAEEE